jgi:hypothetical protein
MDTLARVPGKRPFAETMRMNTRPGSLHGKIARLDFGIGEEFGFRAFVADDAFINDIATVGNGQGEAGVLFGFLGQVPAVSDRFQAGKAPAVVDDERYQHVFQHRLVKLFSLEVVGDDGLF